MSDERVVYLAYRSDKTDTDVRENLACKGCRNKTFTVEYSGLSKFPTLKCACCGNLCGLIGWAEPNDAA